MRDLRAVQEAAFLMPGVALKRAFTLLELMVVIVVVAILAGLLLPAFSKAKASMSRALSVHSLNQLSIAGHLYLTDNDNRFWPYEQPVPGGVQWWFGFETSASLRMPEGQRTCNYSKGPLGPFTMAADGIKTDPAFLQYSPRLKPKYKDGNYGYGYNVILSADANGNPHNALQVTSPVNMVVFATCAQVNTFQAPASPTKPMVEEFYMISDTQVTAHFRHGTDALAAFLDGSVRPLSMQSDMQPGSQDMRLPSANIGRFNTSYLRQDGW
jgi:prepilin-type N-terminal cleavage/methylation domain-containing protein